MNITTKAVRLHGKNDLRLDEFELPEIKDDEVLVKIITDGICTSSYKASILGADHKRVPKNIDVHPIIIGHECCGVVVQTGKKWSTTYSEGEKVVIQPALSDENGRILEGVGYSYEFVGGDATYVIVPDFILAQGCLLKYAGESFFYGSLSEPYSCIVNSFNSMYHTEVKTNVLIAGIKESGSMLVMGGTGPMGLATIDYAINGPRNPSTLVITGIIQEQLDRAEKIYGPIAVKKGIHMFFQNTVNIANVEEKLRGHSPLGYDDIIVMVPIKQLLEEADGLLAKDGCLNFFAGHTDTKFYASVNFYNIHYNSTHILGTAGGSVGDMKQAIHLMEEGTITPESMITHVGGLDCVAETTLNLPNIPGGRKLIYTQKKFPLTALDDFEEKGKESTFFADLAKIIEKHNGLWSAEAEKYFLLHTEDI